MPGKKVDRRNLDGDPPAILAKKMLLLIGVFLVFIGRPFYLFLSNLIILLFFLSGLLGVSLIKLFDVASANLSVFWKKRIKTSGKQFKNPSFPPFHIPHFIRKLAFPRPLKKFTKSLQKVVFSVKPPAKIILGWLKLKRVRIPLALTLTAIFSLTIFWITVLKDLPQPGELITRDQRVSTKIYDKKGRLLFKVFRDENRTLAPLEEIPLHARQATIAIEDSDFYSHPGFSLRGIARAGIRNFTRGELAGGSTITQQLVKNALLSPEKTVARKLKEIVLAVQVELSFSKDQILEMYLNEVSYGGSAYGIEEASQLYFEKSAKDLTLAEAALLAGLPKAPTTYSPFGAKPDLARARQLEVLSRMVQVGYITQDEVDKAAQDRLAFAPQRTDIQAPHFVMHVKQLLAEKYGERIVEEGGLEVITSLDLDIQEKVQKIVFEETEKIKHLRISNGAAVVTDPKTGEILAMVGSKNYFDQPIDGNFNVTTALRQPGSSIKPVNYAYALESGRYTPASMISDTAITYWIPGSEPYSPRNYDNRFRGRVPLRVALGSSLNVPAVKILASYGVDKMIDQGTRMGITTWGNPRRFGLSLTLGGGEVKMVDMAVVYGTISNYGKRIDPNPILKVTNYRGKLLEENRCGVNLVKEESPITSLLGKLFEKVYAAEAASASDFSCGKQVVDPRVAFIITDILRDNWARIPAFGPNSLLVIPGHEEVAVKTGTTQNLRDNWAIGYTQNYVVGAWVGNNDNTPMAYVASGVTGATPIWHKIMRELLENQSNHSWEVPPGVEQVDICPSTGTLPCEGCGGKKEYFLEGTQPNQHCVPKKDQPKPETEQLPEGQSI